MGPSPQCGRRVTAEPALGKGERGPCQGSCACWAPRKRSRCVTRRYYVVIFISSTAKFRRSRCHLLLISSLNSVLLLMLHSSRIHSTIVQNAIAIAARAPTQTTPGELTMLPRHPSRIMRGFASTLDAFSRSASRKFRPLTAF